MRVASPFGISSLVVELNTADRGLPAAGVSNPSRSPTRRRGSFGAGVEPSVCASKAGFQSRWLIAVPSPLWEVGGQGEARLSMRAGTAGSGTAGSLRAQCLSLSLCTHSRITV